MAYIGKIPAAAALTSSDIADSIITEAKMADDAISLTELKAGTDGEVISWDASGNPVAIGAGTSGHFLKSQGAGSQPVFAAAGGGKIGQVVSVIDGVNRTTTSSTLNDMSSNLIAQITPSATNSKILVMCGVNMQSSTYSWYLSLYRDIGGAGYNNLTDVGSYDAFAEVAGAAKNVHVTMVYLDSPSTTSQVSYRPYGGITGSGTLNLNHSTTLGTITAMEVLA